MRKKGGVWRSSMTLPLVLVGAHRVSAFLVSRTGWTHKYYASSTRLPSKQDQHSSFLSSANGDNEDTSLSPDDLDRWESLYQEGQTLLGAKLSSAMSTLSDYPQAARQPREQQIRVVTLDLDNTLWNTSKTIAAANDALAQFLNEHGIVQTQRTEVIMGELFQRDKARYCPTGDDNGTPPKAPVLLTQLRKDALRNILEQPDNGYDPDKAMEFAERAFAKWTEGRHAAIPLHFATDVVACLQQIAQLTKSNTNGDNDAVPILIGAITDGNSDPRNIDVLKQYFDFCVNAEQVGVAKPDKRLYHRAMQYVAAHPSLHDLFSNYNSDEDDDNLQALEEKIGPWWVHVGDDFVKDVVAAKNLNMRTIWARELILGKEKKTDDKTAPDLLVTMGSNAADGVKVKSKDRKTTEQKSKLSPEQELMEFQKKINEQAVVKMAVGADDYLIDSIQNEFADAVIDNFGQLADLLKQWHNHPSPNASMPAEEATINRMPTEIEKNGQNRLKAPVIMSETPSNGILNDDNGALMQKTKFCVFCGAKIPFVAMFCSSCSKKQPQVEP